MKQLSGHGISGGVAAGKLVTLLSAQTGVPRETSRTPDEELQRFAQALREGLWELDALQETARTQTSAEAAQIFEIHKMMLQDEDFCTAVRERLKAEAISCEYAVQQTGKQFETLFSAMDDPYMKARSADVRDVASRLLRCLRGGADAAALPDARCIIAAEELTPSQTIRLDREKVAAFVTARGTANSHAAILARTMGIPAVTGVDMASLLTKRCRGHRRCGDRGRVSGAGRADVHTIRFHYAETAKHALRDPVWPAGAASYRWRQKASPVC